MKWVVEFRTGNTPADLVETKHFSFAHEIVVTDQVKRMAREHPEATEAWLWREQDYPEPGLETVVELTCSACGARLNKHGWCEPCDHRTEEWLPHPNAG